MLFQVKDLRKGEAFGLRKDPNTVYKIFDFDGVKADVKPIFKRIDGKWQPFEGELEQMNVEGTCIKVILGLLLATAE